MDPLSVVPGGFELGTDLRLGVGQQDPFSGVQLDPARIAGPAQPSVKSTLGTPTITQEADKPAQPSHDIRDFAALAAATGTLASMFMPKPKVFRPGAATPMIPRFGNPFPRQ